MAQGPYSRSRRKPGSRSIFPAGSELRRLSSDELAQLIRESNREHLVRCSFGPGHATLLDIPENDWALRRVQEMRKE